ncbi:MAG: transposase [Pseudomonadota bacterium]|uniref:transposase n=1 Tax=Alcanivorax sp. TaxID=1872427 RepID=UPI0025C3D693|nr:transposase [Alcanivorax sp.]MED5238242.1 transposase [Pseudomonadota bacterium]MEE3320088.1 transposase [Pseudomonadota bacterium]
MTRARYQQVSLSETPFYHCICRCVRRAFLCGRDHYSGQDYEHRRQWVVERLATLVDVFAIDLCAYAVMSNHYHVVLRVDRSRAESWTQREVAEHWMRLFSGPLLVQRWFRDETGEAETLKALDIVEEWRSRLYDLGWFMRCLNEHLARKANEEDGCKGRFWEGRYKSQALLDEKALLSCMAYVDLNPVRAGMAATPETSDYTSVQQRSCAVQNKSSAEKVPTLLPLVDAGHIESDTNSTICRMRLIDYLELVGATGRALRSDKRGAIDGSAADILDRLGLDQKVWLQHMAPRKQRAPLAVGSLAKVRAFAEATGRRWIAGQRAACVLG